MLVLRWHHLVQRVVEMRFQRLGWATIHEQERFVPGEVDSEMGTRCLDEESAAPSDREPAAPDAAWGACRQLDAMVTHLTSPSPGRPGAAFAVELGVGVEREGWGLGDRWARAWSGTVTAGALGPDAGHIAP